MITIDSLQPQDAKAAARLHPSNLRTAFTGSVGLWLLEAYYRGLSGSAGACGYGAKRADRLVGFVCGVWDPRRARHDIARRQLPRFLVWGAAYALSHPLRVLQRLSGSAGASAEGTDLGYELRPIVVADEEKGSGVASALVERLAKDARTRGFSRIFLRTELDNIRAQRFYAKAGFWEVSRSLTDGQVYVRFEREV